MACLLSFVFFCPNPKDVPTRHSFQREKRRDGVLLPPAAPSPSRGRPRWQDANMFVVGLWSSKPPPHTLLHPTRLAHDTARGGGATLGRTTWLPQGCHNLWYRSHRGLKSTTFSHVTTTSSHTSPPHTQAQVSSHAKHEGLTDTPILPSAFLRPFGTSSPSS